MAGSGVAVAAITMAQQDRIRAKASTDIQAPCMPSSASPRCHLKAFRPRNHYAPAFSKSPIKLASDVWKIATRKFPSARKRQAEPGKFHEVAVPCFNPDAGHWRGACRTR